jgi:AmmeMemoRadiSam system protein A
MTESTRTPRAQSVSRQPQLCQSAHPCLGLIRACKETRPEIDLLRSSGAKSVENIFIPADSQKRLIVLSRQTLESFVLGTKILKEDVSDSYLTTTDYGAFVSLHRGEELRGCIGTCFPLQPLYETVIEMTEAAASRDQRVLPIRENELSDIHIDIYILSPLEFVASPLSLKVGTHGLHISRGEKRGVLLPQVAAEYGWDIKTFLSQTCVKAGLAKEAWKWPGTQVSSFTALVIEEQK